MNVSLKSDWHVISHYLAESCGNREIYISEPFLTQRKRESACAEFNHSYHFYDITAKTKATEIL